MYLKDLYTDLYKVYFCLQSLQVLLVFFLSHPFVFWCHWSPSFWWLTDLLKSDQAIWRMAHGKIEIDSLSNCFSKIAWVLFEVNTLCISFPSQHPDRDLHEWFYSLPAIILPSLQQCFLKYACPTFPHHLPNSNGCPLLSPPFSSASSPLLLLLSATLLYLWLTQFPGLIHPVVSRQTVEQQTDWLTDRHKAHQRAGIDAYAVPTHPFARMNPSLSASWCQTQIRFFVFAAPDTNMLPPPALPQHHLLFGLKTELQAHPSFHWLAVTACTTLQLHKFRSL